MGRYVARRLVQFIPVILGTLLVLHILSVLTIQIVGDPVRALFGENAPPAVILEQMRANYNLDDDCLQQTGNPCFGLFIERFPVTVRLTLIALVFETIVGILLGVMAGLRKDKFVDNVIRVSSVLL